ncbi:hypothetical protein [Bifidobacterium biavatii]|uniref:The export of O-antigen and teichoic acid related membrane protein n=1 Tax=Bifidobacterium biavatii DSM 23969 TaxID=1437608 RepID=A0A086ZTR9_9BIFI|nr:hypothetical protein [Bifidobacterium biavatii]KFI49919.1 the export of O-antigen and teichoic acid related membrane protein [Bifidobacterium biavatii DSM 23969]
MANATNESHAENETNEATEIVDGKVEEVEVSRHPDPSIPESDLSLADIERRKFQPVHWGVYLTAVLAAIIAPYWLGRMLAVQRTAWLVAHMSVFDQRGLVFLAWTVTLVTLTGLGMAVVESKTWLWRIVFVIGLAAEQFIAGLSLLKLNFWYSTYVVYGDAAPLANATNLGIIAAGFGVAAYAVLWVGLLILIRKDSPLSVLTRSWASFIMFFAIEAAALLIVLFGGLLTTV